MAYTVVCLYIEKDKRTHFNTDYEDGQHECIAYKD